MVGTVPGILRVYLEPAQSALRFFKDLTAQRMTVNYANDTNVNHKELLTKTRKHASLNEES